MKKPWNNRKQMNTIKAHFDSPIFRIPQGNMFGCIQEGCH